MTCRKIQSSIGSLKSGIAHYNEIPFYCVKDARSILDIGSSNGLMAYLSKYARFFNRINKRGNYLGIDIQSFHYLYYPIKQVNVFDFEARKKYDLVLALHVIEHFDIQQWQTLFDKLYGWVSKNGYLVVNVPFKQKKAIYKDKLKVMRHKVFGIDKQTIEQFLPNGHFTYSKARYLPFKEDHELLFFAILRFFYRAITLHPYSIFKRRICPRRIIGVWQKNE